MVSTKIVENNFFFTVPKSEQVAISVILEVSGVSESFCCCPIIEFETFVRAIARGVTKGFQKCDKEIFVRRPF